MTEVKRRLPTSCVNEQNVKWTKKAVVRGEYRFLNGENNPNPPWISPRHTGCLHEVKGVPEHYRRDRDMLERSRDLLLGVKSETMAKECKPFGVKTGFFTRRLGHKETLNERQSVTRHNWSVILPRDATSVPSRRPRQAVDWWEQPAATGRQRPRSVLAGREAGPVLRLEGQTDGAGEARTFKGNGQDAEALRAIVDQRNAEIKMQKKMTRDLRMSMKEHFKDTRNLPMNLWNAFKTTDRDGSGRIDFSEFSGVCEGIGLKKELIGEEGQMCLFKMCDKDGGGSIDFNEFLTTLVGNIVKL